MKALRYVAVLMLLVISVFVLVTQAWADDNRCTHTDSLGYKYQWFYSWTIEFPKGYWEVGQHTYDIYTSAPDRVVQWHRVFWVNESASPYKGQVYLRSRGLTTLDGLITEINPMQDTVMQLGWKLYDDTTGEPYSRQQAEAHRAATVTRFRWDGGEWVTVSPDPLMSACAWNNPGLFDRSWGPNY